MNTEQLEMFQFTAPSFKDDADRKKLEWEQETAFWQAMEDLRYRCDGEHKADRTRWVKAALEWSFFSNTDLNCLDDDRRFQRWVVRGLLFSWLLEMTGEADNEYTPLLTEDEKCRCISNAIAKLKRSKFKVVAD
jgi:hypothetical protein